MAIDLSKHPCFSAEARHKFGRIHLAVAPDCNVQCNFCDRKFDCANESRPGVTSAVLKPREALEYFIRVKQRVANLSVVGIAGPGDPFANPDPTMQTLRLCREHDPELLLCVASNGLNVSAYARELGELQVTHVTITLNAIDPEVGGRVYAWVRHNKRVYRGREAGEVLLGRQLDAIAALKSAGVTVKINTILMPGVNDRHVVDVARHVAGMGVDMHNIMAMYPVTGTPFEALGAPPGDMVDRVREAAGAFVPQMKHCAHCRADAVGLLGQDQSRSLLDLLTEVRHSTTTPDAHRPGVAVATQEGMLVNQHLGEAGELHVFRQNGAVWELKDVRPAPAKGHGPQRWVELAKVLHDCKVILTSGAGQQPRQVLDAQGIAVVLTEGLIEQRLQELTTGRRVQPPSRAFGCGTGCSGGGQGCS